MAAEIRGSVPTLEGENWHEAYNTICKYYRLALFNALYCGKRLGRSNAMNLTLEICIAILAAIAAALSTQSTSVVDPRLVSGFAIAAAALAALHPVLKLSDNAARYAIQHGGYRDIYLAYQDLVALVRVEGRVTPATWREHVVLCTRYRALEAASDPNPSKSVRTALFAEVEQQIPVDSLRFGP